MKKTILLIITLVITFSFVTPKKSYKKDNNVFYGLPVLDGNGKTLTEKKACTLCHKPEEKVVGPSFKDIAVKYNGDATKIMNFLEGKSNPIVQPEEFQYMKPVLNQLKRSSKEERQAIANYIASLK